jgi:hypothetical protein
METEQKTENTVENPGRGFESGASELKQGRKLLGIVI